MRESTTENGSGALRLGTFSAEGIAEPPHQLEALLEIAQDPIAIQEIKKIYSSTLHDVFEKEAYPSVGRPDSFTLGPGVSLSTWRRLTPNNPFRPTPDEDKLKILGEDFETKKLVELKILQDNTNTSYERFASFVFSADTKDISDNWGQRSHGKFTSPDLLHFEGAYLFNGSYGDGQLTGDRIPLEQAIVDDDFRSTSFSNESIGCIVEKINQPRNDCSEAKETVQELGDGLDVDKETIETMQNAISDYATYVKPEPINPDDRFKEIGRCFTVPGNFIDFCNSWYGLDLKTAFYEKSVGRTPTFFHQVNLFASRIVVDWTARQYKDETPYPYVYMAGDPEVRSSWGELHVSIL